MYLHKDDKELLRDIIVTVSERTGIDESIVEKRLLCDNDIKRTGTEKSQCGV